MLKEGAIRKVQPSKEEFLSNVFLVKKKHGCQRPVINLPLFHNVSSEWEVCKICNTCCKEITGD